MPRCALIAPWQQTVQHMGPPRNQKVQRLAWPFPATNELASTPGMKSTPRAAAAGVKPGVVCTPGWLPWGEARTGTYPHPPRSSSPNTLD